MVIEIKDKVVSFKKDCKDCDKYEVCKFHQVMADLCKSNLMYGMTKYAESNNTLTAFDLYSNCQHFKFKKELPKSGEAITLNTSYEILSRIVNIELKHIRPLQSNIDTKSDNVECLISFGNSQSSANTYKNFILSELIKDYIYA